MIASDVLSKVRRIEILASRLVAETFGGEYQSVFKGRGMEFADVREYLPGDDVRSIDWNVTARTGKPHIRQYVEERELTVVIACDLSGSQFFGSSEALKKEIAAELAAVLAFSALQNNDKVGLFLFTDQVEEYVPPRKGRRHILHLIRDVLAYQPKRKGTKLQLLLERANRVLKRRSILILISDFRDEGFEKALKLASLKHDVIPIVIRDPYEEKLPALGAYLEIENPETGRRTLINPKNSAALADYARRETEERARLERMFKRYNLDSITIRTDRSYVNPIVQFFRARAKRLAR